MDQQAIGEDKPKISRSKARHLRRKRLAAARKIAESSSSQTRFDTEQTSSHQEPDNILSKSKARRLRKKKKAESVEGSNQTLKAEKCATDSDNQIESVISSQSPTNVSEYNKSDGNICALQFDSESSNRENLLTLTEITAPNSPDFDGLISAKNRENDTLLTYQKNSSLNTVLNSKNFCKVQTGRHSASSDDSLRESRILFSDHNPDFESTSSSRIPNFKSNQFGKDNEIVNEKDDVDYQHKTENKHTLDIGSSNPIKTTASCFLRTDATSDDDLDSPSSSSSSNLIEQYDINTIQADDSLRLIMRTVKAVLNTTELIENEKNLKISSSSSNSRTVFQSNAPVIDLTTYSSSGLIIDTDSTSQKLEEQQIIDFISDSSPDLVQNNKLFYTDPPETSSTESQTENKIHKKSLPENLLTSENQTSFDIIKDYSLPSTSVNDSVPPVIQDSVAYKTVDDSNSGYNKSEAKMSSTEKTREQIKAEREAKKAAKALAKNKAKVPKSEEKEDAKSSKDTSAKGNNSEQVQKAIKQNVAVKKEAVPLEEKILPTENESATSTDNKENETQSKGDGKSKRESRAERRAKQEAQRAAKEKQAIEKNKPKSTVSPKSKPSPKVSEPVKMVVRKTLADNNLHEVKLFKHLYHERELSLVNFPTLNSNIHPAIVRLGVQYANKVIIGSNARCIALLAAVKQLIEDFDRPSQADFTRGLEASLQESAAYLHHCRPMAVSMQNALKHLKWQMTQLPTTVSDNDAKSKLGDAIETYIREQILLAGKAISNTIQTKISNGDVILTYAFSSLIHKILIDAHIAGKQFRVIVVDGRPWLEGKEQLRRLAKHGIECSYILINALSFIMPEVSKVFLGAHAILANGAVMSRAGTAQVALMAKAFNVPVLVACETHKSCERVQTDSFVYNEIGDADELARNLFSNSKRSLLVNWKTKKSLDLLNITFDVTPADLVSAVVTELAILPCTSIPVILRIKPSEI